MQVMFLLAMMTAFYAVYTSFTFDALTTGNLVRQQQVQAVEEYFHDVAKSINTLAVQSRISLPVYPNESFAYLGGTNCATLPAGLVTAPQYVTSMTEVLAATPQRWQGARDIDPWGNPLLIYAKPELYHPGAAQFNAAATVAVTTQATGFVLASAGHNGCFGADTIAAIAAVQNDATASLNDVIALSKKVPSTNPSDANYDRFAVDDIVLTFHTKNAIDQRFAMLEDQVNVVLSAAMQRYERMARSAAFQNDLNTYFASQMTGAFNASGQVNLSGSVNPDSWRYVSPSSWTAVLGTATDSRPSMSHLLAGQSHDLKQLFVGQGTAVGSGDSFNPWEFLENHNALEIILTPSKSDATMVLDNNLTLTLSRQANKTLNAHGEVASAGDHRVPPFDTNFTYSKTIGEDL